MTTRPCGNGVFARRRRLHDCAIRISWPCSKAVDRETTHSSSWPRPPPEGWRSAARRSSEACATPPSSEGCGPEAHPVYPGSGVVGVTAW
jgi:hypothetical protein